MKYDFSQPIARARELQAQATAAGLPRYAIAALILADSFQTTIENAVHVLATLALPSDDRPMFSWRVS